MTTRERGGECVHVQCRDDTKVGERLHGDERRGGQDGWGRQRQQYLAGGLQTRPAEQRGCFEITLSCGFKGDPRDQIDIGKKREREYEGRATE